MGMGTGEEIKFYKDQDIIHTNMSTVRASVPVYNNTVRLSS